VDARVASKVEGTGKIDGDERRAKHRAEAQSRSRSAFQLLRVFS
jgi:hypothetical protein